MTKALTPAAMTALSTLAFALDELSNLPEPDADALQDAFDHSATHIREAFGGSLEEVAASVLAFMAENHP
jgi:hypothetical protein